MTQTRVYLDANATETIRPQAMEAVQAAMLLGANPSSIHAEGRDAKHLLEAARDAVGRRFGVPPAQIVFTSGGTEADALAIHALGAGQRVIIGATEHDAVRKAAPDATILPVDGEGVADLEALRHALEGAPALVCLMLANNETGTIQPIAEAAQLCRKAGALLHVDAAQAPGRMAVTMPDLGCDSLAISGHKMGAPPGIGALLFAAQHTPRPLIAGGGQERFWRGGTQALPAIAGLAAACAIPPTDLAALRDALEADLPGFVAGRQAPRLGNTTCLVLPGVAAQTQVMTLDLAGFAVSAGAACSSGKVQRSHVLEAMGLGEHAGHAIRVSLPWHTTAADVAAFREAYRAMAQRLLRRAA